VRILKKISLLIISLIFCIVAGQATYAQTYIPIDKKSAIKSVILKGKTAHIKMSDYSVTIPLRIMNDTDYKRANGVTPKGMKIGLKYNDTLLRLVAIDAIEKNYMVADFIVPNANTTQLNLPDGYKEQIDKNDIYIASVQFIQSYPLWSADSVARGFDLLASKEKGIIQLFPAINLELADKLCRANSVTAGIFELLPETQKITCDDLLLFNHHKNLEKLKILANQERPLLVKVLDCAQGNKHPQLCQKINQQLAKKIVNSVTLSTLLKTIP
jgi:hypothetical protein